MNTFVIVFDRLHIYNINHISPVTYKQKNLSIYFVTIFQYTFTGKKQFFQHKMLRVDDVNATVWQFNLYLIKHSVPSTTFFIGPLVKTFPSFPHSRLNTRFETILLRRVPLVEQELLTLPGHMSSPPVFSRFRVTSPLALCVCFLARCLSFFF